MKKVLLLAFVAAMSVTSCTDDEKSKATLSKTSYTLYHSETAQIQGTNIDACDWWSSNDFVATISDGVIKGQYVGYTEVKATEQGLSFGVVVNPKYRLYIEPNMDWGASQAIIKSQWGEPVSSSNEGLIFQSGNPDVPYYVYMFNNTGMYCCGVVVKASAASTLADFLTERYLTYSVDMSTYTAYFAHCSGKKDNPDVDYAVSMRYSASLGGILVVYVNGNSSSKIDINGVIENALIDGEIEL